MLHEEALTEKVLGAAIEVHRALGPGLLESAYEACLCHELNLCGLPFQCQLKLPVVYKGVRLDCGFKIDVIVDQRVLVEIKSVKKLIPVHEAQLLTYLRLTGIKIGLLINFNVPVLKDGIVRMAL